MLPQNLTVMLSADSAPREASKNITLSHLYSFYEKLGILGISKSFERKMGKEREVGKEGQTSLINCREATCGQHSQKERADQTRKTRKKEESRRTTSQEGWDRSG